MSNKLNLMVAENSVAKSISQAFNNEEIRKEVYLKYLIISALEKNIPSVEAVDSAAFSCKFYDRTRLFDFYVNNNIFDLIVLKPDSDDLLFEIKQDDIHANLYGYIVVRPDENLENVDILGFFQSKDLDTFIADNKLLNTDLTAISAFEEIEILDSQMTLEDVSDTFFELLAGFFDDNLDNDGFAEFACLLYNSSELRGVFADVGRFESICGDLKDNQDLIQDEFLSVLAADGAEKSDDSIDETEEFLLEDLDVLEDDSAEELPPESPEEVELNVEPDEAEYEVDLDSVFEESAAADVEEETLIPFEDEETADEFTLVDNDEDLMTGFDGESLDLAVEETVEPDDSDTSQLGIDESDLDDIEEISEINEFDLANLDELSEIEGDSNNPEGYLDEKQPQSKLAQELQSLSLVEEESQIPAIALDEELLGILNSDTEENVVVDNDELMSILGADSETITKAKFEPSLEYEEEYVSDETDDKISELDELVESSPHQKSGDLKLLFTEENPTSDESFHAEEIAGVQPNKKAIKKKSNVIILASVLATVAVVLFVVTKFSGNSNTDSDMSSSDTSYMQNTDGAGMPSQMPPSAENTVAPDSGLPPIQNNVSAQAPGGDTNIVSSLSKDIKSGSAPVILKSVAWQVPSSISGDTVFSKYLQIAGKNIKMNLAADLLNTSDFAYNNKIKVSMKVKNNAPVRDVKIIESSGSKDVDDIVLQSIKQTLKYINSPVMSSDSGDREVVLVISI